MTFRVQELIHKWELGGGQRVVTVTAAVLAFVGLAVWFDLRAFKGLSTAEGLDAAQLARNISRGQGFSTSVVRPLSIYLLARNSARSGGLATSPPRADATNSPATGAEGKSPSETSRSRLNPSLSDFQRVSSERHPDLANPPLYPGLLAGFLKISDLKYEISNLGGVFNVYWPDLWVAGFNQLLFLIVLLFAFRLARLLFDAPVAWLSCIIIAGIDLYWKLTGTGHSTILLMAIVLLLLIVLARIDRQAREEPNFKSQIILAALAGLLVGLAALSRYSFVMLIVPVAGWLALTPSPRRTTLAAVATVVFAAVLLPWVIRNFSLSGTPFGVAGYSFATATRYFSGDELERSLKPDLNRIEPHEVGEKLISNTTDVVQSGLADFAGTWATALFWVGLLVPFRNPTLSRIRWLLLSFVIVLLLTQALGLTASENLRLSSENLLVVVGPAVLIFGVGFLFTLVDGLPGPADSRLGGLRITVLAVAAALVWWPLLRSLTSFHISGYYPPAIQEKALSIEKKAVLVTDIPWATAWYGDRQSVWLTLRHREPDQAPEGVGNDFYSLYRVRPISALYLAGKGLDSIRTANVARWRQETGTREGDDWTEFLQAATGLMKQLSASKDQADALRRLLQLADQHWAFGGEKDWADFLLGIYVNREVPTGFPLKRAPFGLWPELFLTETERKQANPIQSQ